MNKFFKGLATLTAASTLCICPLNAAENTRANENTTVVEKDKPSQISIIWNAGWLGKGVLIFAILGLVEAGYIVVDKVFGVSK